MANTKSAIKTARRISRETKVNKLRKSRFKNAIKKMNVLIEKKNKKEALSYLPKLINHFGVINVGGKSRSSYNFAKFHNKKTVKAKNKDKNFPSKQTMNLNKLKKILN